MSQTTGDQDQVTTMTFNYDEYDSIYVPDFRNILVTLGLLGTLYGVLTVLSVLSIRALTQRSTRKTRPTVIALCLTIITLFASTTIDMVTYIISTQSILLSIAIQSGLRLWVSSPKATYFFPPIIASMNYSPLQTCASTTALTINITLGDAIVCWRACVIWHKNRVVRAVCSVFLLTTFGLGLADTLQGCQIVTPQEPPILETPSFSVPDTIGALYEGAPVGIAACVLSLSTNLTATLLVAYKAWRSRRRLRGYLMAGGSQVGKLFALLIESGAIYCAIWIVVVAFQIAEYKWEIRGVAIRTGGTLEPAGRRFLDIIKIVCTGTLVPVIAIYPMIIIVLVAQDRSHIEKGLSQHIESLPTPHLAFTANANVTSGTTQRRTSEVLLIGLDGQNPECGGGADDAGTHGVSKEWKQESMA